MSTPLPDLPMVDLQGKVRREAVDQLTNVVSRLHQLIVRVVQVVDDLPTAEPIIEMARDALAGVEDAIGGIGNPFIWGDDEEGDRDDA